MEISPEEKAEIREKIEKYLARGNPLSFLVKIGVMNIDHTINFEKAKAVFKTVKDNEEQILSIFKEAGYQVKKHKPQSGNGFIANP